MFNIFEKPWTLIGIAVLVLLGLLQFRSIFPEKRQRWQWLIPAFLAVAAFGLDFFVKTDLEKINAVIKTSIKAVQQEDCDAIEAIIADDYSDSYHNTKADLMAHCRRELARSTVEKNKKANLLIEMSGPQATAVLTVWIRFDKDSYAARNYKQLFLAKVRLNLQKQRNKRWLINRAELLELDRQPVSWRNIR
ncbi:MAG: hypothetical protein ACETVZ_07770 [Phycisphaerae bacterium]